MTLNQYYKTIKAQVIALLVIAFAYTANAQDFSNARQKVQKLFDKELKKKNVHNAFLEVYSPAKNIIWNFAGGTFKNRQNVTATNPFHSASIGKTFTAVAIAMLQEQGKLEFADEIAKYLSDSITNGLHVFEGKDYSTEITIAQLLQHTSGIADYYEGKTIDGSPNALELLVTDTTRFWKPREMVHLAKTKMKPNFAPATGYAYSDTEYILLGLIVESISGIELHDFFRKNIFSPLNMQHTYMYLRSHPIAETAPMAELYTNKIDVSQTTSLSLDWAGGGIVTTASDLNKFQVAFHSNKFLKAKTREMMQQWIRENKGMYYGYGLRKVVFKELFPLLPHLSIIGHTGSTSSFMFYCPELEVYLSGTLNQTKRVKQSVVIPVKVLSVLRKENKN